MNDPVRTHYDGFLADNYSRISGGWELQVQKNLSFFSSHTIAPPENRVAIDLGAGNGFQSIPLAMLGYSVTAVDFCRPLLDELRTKAEAWPVVTVQSDIRHYSSWAGQNPALIVCMGDTLTHLPTLTDAEDLIRHCFSELATGSRLVLTLRDYSREPDGEVVVIPVERGENRIFLCRLKYHPDTLTVQDILYSRHRGIWERTFGNYTKIRIAPGVLFRMLTRVGFSIEYSSVKDRMITVIAGKAA